MLDNALDFFTRKRSSEFWPYWILILLKSYNKLKRPTIGADQPRLIAYAIGYCNFYPIISRKEIQRTLSWGRMHQREKKIS